MKPLISERFISLLLVLSMFGCESPVADSEAEKKSATADEDGGEENPKSKDKNDRDDTVNQVGSLSIGDEVSSNLGMVEGNLEVVQSNLGPPAVGALSIDSSGSSLALLDLGSEAEEVEERVRGTIEGTMRALGWIRDTISSIQPELQGLDAKSGTVDMGFLTIEYRFETSNKYTVRSIGGEAGNYHIEVDGSSYTLFRTPNNPPANQVGDNKVVVSYTDDNNWTLRDDNTTDDCDANRPETITTYVERTSGIWYGKMGYGNESVHNNCPVEIAGQHYTYFQFVGDDDKTTAAGYSDVPLGFSDFAQIEQFGFADESEQSVNPVCLTKGIDPEPQTACQSDDTDVSTPNFGIDDKWVNPDDLVQIRVAFPDSL